MGSGDWDASKYATTRSVNASRGIDDFAYSTHTMTSTPPEQWKVHETLDPKGADREARDSDEHPTSMPVTVAFDVTGSMAMVPRLLLDKLPRLFGLLSTKGYLEHPQLMFAAIGDATCDHVPLQVGQWESDNRADEQLTNILLESGGGGSRQESYELFAYFMARHTATDAWEKRGEKGFLFVIGDEMPYDMVKPNEVAMVVGDTLEQPIPSSDIWREVTDRFYTWYLMPQGSNYFASGYQDTHLDRWRADIGAQAAVIAPGMDMIAETIAGMIGMTVGAVELDDLATDLREVGAGDDEVKSVTNALATVGGGAGGLVHGDAPTTGDETGTTRL